MKSFSSKNTHFKRLIKLEVQINGGKNNVKRRNKEKSNNF